MAASSNLRLLGVFAHPDDEVFCLGGTFAKYVAAGAEAMVVSFTQGEAGQIRFVGEQGVAYGQPRKAHVVAATNTTCLILSPGAPTQFAGRGEQAQHANAERPSAPTQIGQATARIDVRAFVDRKMAAMAAHRSQYPVTAEMLPATWWMTCWAVSTSPRSRRRP